MASSDIFHSWNSFRSKEINKLLGRTETLWQKESFDDNVCAPEQRERIERYIHDNRCGLPADRFSLGGIHYIKPYPTNDLPTASGE